VKTSVFYLSDSTGITVETLATSLFSHFDTLEINPIRRPNLSGIEDIKKVAEEISQAARESESPTIVFSSLISEESREVLRACPCELYDIYDLFIKPMENKLGIKSSAITGRSHGIGETKEYNRRMNAINFCMANDDGENILNFEKADIIIIGVSRTGKTPTSLYLALNHSLNIANYPLTNEDLESDKLPDILKPFKSKLFGLTINPTRLQQIRHERRPNSQYSSLSQCQYEIRTAEVLYRQTRIPFIDTSSISIEEISVAILNNKHLLTNIVNNFND